MKTARQRPLFDYESSESRGERVHFRVFEGFVVLSVVALGMHWALKASELSVLVAPIGLAKYVNFTILLSSGAPFVLAVMLGVLCLCGFMRRAPGAAYGFALLIFHILYTLRFSMGKVGHGSNFIGMSLLGLWLGMLFFDAEYHRRRFVLGFTCAFIGFAYLLAAGAKMIGTGIFWSDGRHLWMWMAERTVDLTSQRGAYAPGSLQTFILSHPLAATLLLSTGLVTEACGWFMWRPRLRPWFTIAAVGMHAGITLVMGIHFTLYVVELLLIGLPWSRFLDRIMTRNVKQEALMHNVPAHE